MQDFFAAITQWNFMNEPLWRWAIFFGALLGIMWGWNGVLNLMK